MPDPQLAVDRIRGWLAAGFTDDWIASACGINKWQVHRIAARTRRGQPSTLFHGTTRLVLAADIRDGDSGMAPALGLTRRLQALVALGYTQDHVSAATGISQGLLSRITRGLANRSTARNWHALVAYYDEVSMTPGPSSTARANARKRGWVPPLAWDDETIDDPNARPDTGEGAPKRPNGGSGRPAEYVVEDVEWYLEQVNRYATPKELTVRLGYSEPNSLYMALMRAGRDDLRDVLIRNGVADGSHGDLERSVARRKGRAA
jgi:transcriptional regulator with XRE-family HTH domain